ncbi:MAG TPA: glycosyltransferase [Acidimicrobiales bacterium]|nr:glycosyltransferase [Acidimicrobiales bacterium]
MATGHDLTVVIPTRDRWDILRRTLGALGSQSVSGFEVVLVVDGTDQRVPDLGDVTVLVQAHAGPGVARNRGVEHSHRPMVLFLGDDMVPDPRLVEFHLDGHHRHDATHDGVLGKVVWHDEVRSSPTLRWIDRSGTQFDYANITGPDAGWGRFYSCNVSLKRDFFTEAGGFDPDFEFDYEDLDLGYRLDQKGLSLWFEPQALARHLHAYDFSRLARRYASHARGEQVMAAKHPWFSPFFGGRIRAALDRGRVSPAWVPLAGWRRPRALAELAARRADTWFLRQLAPYYLAAWGGEQDRRDLEEYLGPAFDRRLLDDHQRAVDAEEEAAADEATFYRTSQMYLYDLTAFAMAGTKTPYLDSLRATVPAGASILDYGCGIGSDGLRLLEDGYHVAFADFDNPSTRYLRWRLERRGQSAPVYDIEGEVPGGFDAAFAFDVIEHVEDPLAFVAALEQRAAVVAVNLLEPDPADTHLHRPLPIEALVRRATDKGLLYYRVFHGRSHLLVYRSEGRGGVASRARWARGRLAAVADPIADTVRRRLRG